MENHICDEHSETIYVQWNIHILLFCFVFCGYGMGSLWIYRIYLPVFITVTVLCCYNMVNFLSNPHNRHPISRLSGWDMGCLWWEKDFDLFNVGNTAVLCEITYYIRLHYNGTWPDNQATTKYNNTTKTVCIQSGAVINQSNISIV